MTNVVPTLPPPMNEPVRAYRPGSAERTSLQAELARQLGGSLEIPAIVGGREVRTGKIERVTSPHDHGHLLAEAHLGGAAEVEMAIAAAAEAWQTWSRMPFAGFVLVAIRRGLYRNAPFGTRRSEPAVRRRASSRNRRRAARRR